jgi:hypothetical protein
MAVEVVVVLGLLAAELDRVEEDADDDCCVDAESEEAADTPMMEAGSFERKRC